MTMFQIFSFIVGVQLFVFGLNGFKVFLPIPRQTPSMQKAVEVFINLPQFMNFIKIYEIITGLMLLLQFKSHLVLVLLMPLIFMIFYFQWTLNRPFSRAITIQLFLPYFILLIISFERFSKIFMELVNVQF